MSQRTTANGAGYTSTCRAFTFEGSGGIRLSNSSLTIPCGSKERRVPERSTKVNRQWKILAIVVNRSYSQQAAEESRCNNDVIVVLTRPWARQPEGETDEADRQVIA